MSGIKLLSETASVEEKKEIEENEENDFGVKFEYAQQITIQSLCDSYQSNFGILPIHDLIICYIEWDLKSLIHIKFLSLFQNCFHN